VGNATPDTAAAVLSLAFRRLSFSQMEVYLIDTTISRLLDRHKPAGAQWVVYIDDDGFKSAYGPFGRYEEAQKWVEHHAPYHAEVIPLYQPTSA